MHLAAVGQTLLRGQSEPPRPSDVRAQHGRVAIPGSGRSFFDEVSARSVLPVGDRADLAARRTAPPPSGAHRSPGRRDSDRGATGRRSTERSVAQRSNRCYAVNVSREISVRDLRNHTAEVVAAVRAGERLSLTVNRLPVADIVPHAATRSPWVPSQTLRSIVQEAGADPELLADLADVRSSVLDGE